VREKQVCPLKNRWETPTLEVLPIVATQNNGGPLSDDIHSPAPS
jgi:hypothetical protein